LKVVERKGEKITAISPIINWQKLATVSSPEGFEVKIAKNPAEGENVV